MPEPLIDSSFKIYSAICPKHIWQVHLNIFKRNSQFGSIWPWTLKESNRYIVEYVLGKLLSIFWKNCQWVAQAYGGHILIKSVKETTGLFKEELMGSLIGSFNLLTAYSLTPSRPNWWVHWEFAHHLPTGSSVGKLFKNSQQTLNVPIR